VTEFRNEGANGVRSITEDKNGDFWFNTENRYSVYDSTTLKSNKFYTRHESIGSLDGKNTIGLNEYLSTVRDNDNNLWFVTYRDGVWKYDGTKITHYQVQEIQKTLLYSVFTKTTMASFGLEHTKMVHINLTDKHLKILCLGNR
jgi:ligand-binding sensor domain-containing protein